MTRTIDLPAPDLAILRQVLRDHLPPSTEVWVFGSRVTGTARRYSDLDLALQGDAALEWSMMAQLKDALSESDLAVKVDVVDLLAADPAFRRILQSEMVALPSQ